MMLCNRFIGETLVHTLWLLDRSVVAAAAAMYQEATNTLMSLLVKVGLSFNVSGALRHVQSISQLLCVKRRDYGNVSLVRGSYLFDFDVRQLFVH